jgi:hypothetical protein
MSSNNNAAAASATAAPHARPKSAPSLSGFDLLADRLLASFHAAAPPSASKSANGVLNSTFRALKTSFSGSQGNVRGSKKRAVVADHQAFSEYCYTWNEDCTDQPSRICHNLLTMLEAYFRCVHAVKVQNFWLLEAEDVRWLPCYKVVGKNNYFHEGLHRMEMLYGGALTDVELEELVSPKTQVRSRRFCGIQMPQKTEANVQPPRKHTNGTYIGRTDIPIAFRWSNRCCHVRHGFVSKIAS